MSIFKKTPMASSTAAKQLDFVAIGDMVIDAFIRLQTAHETLDNATHEHDLCMPFGTKIPFEFAEEVVAVGNSANAAVSAARIGLSSALIAHVGDDENGKKCLTQLTADKVATAFIGIHKNLHTNYHYVLWYGTERTILIKHEDFPLIMPDVGSPRYLYLSSLSEKSLPFHTKIADYLDTHPDIKLIFQPGTYQIKFGTDALARIYKRTELFFCNLEEAQIILNIHPDAPDARDIKKLLAGLRALGPKLPVITDGPNGSYTYISDATGGASGANETNSNGAEYVAHLPIYPDVKAPYERTGAGDAFASAFSSAIALGKNVEEALMWGSVDSMNVCQYVGAQKGLLPSKQIQEFLDKKPQDWGIEKVA